VLRSSRESDLRAREYEFLFRRLFLHPGAGWSPTPAGRCRERSSGHCGENTCQRALILSLWPLNPSHDDRDEFAGAAVLLTAKSPVVQSGVGDARALRLSEWLWPRGASGDAGAVFA
jgi:hypothetical protein